MITHYPTPTAGRILRFEVSSAAGERETVEVTVQRVLNFGYAARDQEGLRSHLEECASRGLPVPATVPALYPIIPTQVTTGDNVIVSGSETYAEVEYALVRAGQRWLITVASDHSDAAVEQGSVSRAKNMAPNVLASDAWWLDDVADRLDRMVLSCEPLRQGRVTGPVQRDTLATLLGPRDLVAIASQRMGEMPPPGTVLLSGTIGGEPQAGEPGWRIVLEDPVAGDRIAHEYVVQALAAEIPDGR